nr:LHFPL tetraspan subfamily member 2a protein-like [Cherax quadricarinatus]
MCGGVVLIVTRWWLAWLLWSVACVMALLGANLSPSWLLAPPSTDPATPQHLGLVTQPVQNYTSFIPSFLQDQSSGGPAEWSAWRSVRERPRASLGLWLRCTVMGSEPRTSLHCGVYVTAVPDLPSAQVVALVGVVSATVVTAVSCLAICSSACLRLISGRNWFTIIGTMQATAGAMCLAGVAAFPMGWDSPRVQNQCGADAGVYYPSSCTVGWATYLTLAASIGLLLCTCLSSFAAKSTTTEDVAEEINKGNNVVCLI